MYDIWNVLNSVVQSGSGQLAAVTKSSTRHTGTSHLLLPRSVMFSITSQFVI